MKTGNIGVITFDDNPELHIVDGFVAGLVYCHAISNRRVRVVLPDNFWVILDSLPWANNSENARIRPGFFEAVCEVSANILISGFKAIFLGWRYHPMHWV